MSEPVPTVRNNLGGHLAWWEKTGSEELAKQLTDSMKQTKAWKESKTMSSDDQVIDLTLDPTVPIPMGSVGEGSSDGPTLARDAIRRTDRSQGPGSIQTTSPFPNFSSSDHSALVSYCRKGGPSDWDKKR